MWLLIAEAFIALGMLVFIVWWTMSGRRKDAPAQDVALEKPQPAIEADPATRVASDETQGPDKGPH